MLSLKHVVSWYLMVSN